MPGATQRSEYYWIDGRVVQRKGVRPSGYGRWRLGGDPQKLVCTIERDATGIRAVTPGPAHTPNRANTAVLMELGRYAPKGLPTLGRNIPEALLRQVRQRISSAVATVARQFQKLSNEERTTGALMSRIDGEIRSGGWRVEIATQGFSSAGEFAKEPRTGGDLGMIVDIANGDQRVVKGMLVQAKRAPRLPDDPLDLPGLRDQLGQCRAVTRESYGWIYTPHGVVVVRDDDANTITLENQVEDALKCTRGDVNPRAVASAIDRDYTVEVLASGPQSTGAQLT